VVLTAEGKVVGLLFGNGPVNGVPSYYVCRIDRILQAFAADYDLEIITNPGHGHEASPATDSLEFSTAPAAQGTSETFEPSPEERVLLKRASDEMLATQLGQFLKQIISRHVWEIRTLIRTKGRVAAVWRRVGTPALLHAAVDALRSPETPIPELVNGTPLADRIAALVRVLTRYGSKNLIADLNRLSPVAMRLSAGSCAEFRTWLETTRSDQI
jgi:hypothetical protein